MKRLFKTSIIVLLIPPCGMVVALMIPHNDLGSLLYEPKYGPFLDRSLCSIQQAIVLFAAIPMIPAILMLLAILFVDCVFHIVPVYLSPQHQVIAAILGGLISVVSWYYVIRYCENVRKRFQPVADTRDGHG